jgi:hypothetical protein
MPIPEGFELETPRAQLAPGGLIPEGFELEDGSVGKTPTVDFATQGRVKQNLATSGLSDSINMFPAGYGADPITQINQNAAAAPKLPQPTRIVQSEQQSPDLVSAFEMPVQDLGKATGGFMAEAPKILTRTQQNIRNRSSDPINHMITHAAGGTATSLVSPIAGAAEGLTRSLGMDTVADAAGSARKTADKVGEYFSDALPTQTFSGANDPLSYVHAGGDAIATNALQFAAGGLVARGMAILSKAALTTRGVTAASAMNKAAVMGGLTGAYGLNATVETGSIYNDQPDDKKDFGRAAGYGAAAAVLDTAGDALIIGKSGVGKYLLNMEKESALKAVGTEGMSFLAKTAQGAKTAVGGYVAEYGQEGLQTLIERTGSYKENLKPAYQSDSLAESIGNVTRALSKGDNPFNDEAWSEVKESAQAGGAMGGGLGGGGHALSTVIDKQRIAALASSQTDPAVRAELAQSALLSMPDGPAKQQAETYFNDKIASNQDMDSASDLFMKPVMPTVKENLTVQNPVTEPSPVNKQVETIIPDSSEAKPLTPDVIKTTVGASGGSTDGDPDILPEVQDKWALQVDGAQVAVPDLQSGVGGTSGDNLQSGNGIAEAAKLESQATTIENFIKEIGGTTDPALLEVVDKARVNLESVRGQIEAYHQSAKGVSSDHTTTDGASPQESSEVAAPVTGTDHPGTVDTSNLIMPKGNTVPFKTETAAKTAQTTRKMQQTHTVVPHLDGFALAPISETKPQGVDNGRVPEPAVSEKVDGKTPEMSTVRTEDVTPEPKGRALFTPDQLKEFDQRKIDVSGVTSNYKNEALQQIGFQQEQEKKLASLDYNEQVQAEYDRIKAAQKGDAKTTPAEVVKEAVKVANKEGTPLKEQKKFLLENIEDAIAAAPDTVDTSAAIRGSKLDMDVADQSGIAVTIHVPDDGVFRVINSKEHLQTFKKNVEKMFPTVKYKPGPTPSEIRGDSPTIEAEAQTAIKLYGTATSAIEKMQAAVESGAHEFSNKKAEKQFNGVIEHLKGIAAKETPAVSEPTTNSKPKTKIEDFGEKVGGARKDLAKPTGEKTIKAKSDVPAWKRRYIAMENVKTGKWSLVDNETGRSLGRTEFATQEEAEQFLPIAVIGIKHRIIPDGDKFKIIRNVTDRKRVTIKDDFATNDDAMKYMAEYAQEIIETNTTFGEEILAKPEEVFRTGVERRTGDATKEYFASAFGFRAVEFGNWNNQEERQVVMNHAYDGLLDLAEILHIPAKAISLNGDLALAFGARGQGLSGAKAHYEPSYAVINLTKMSGAGSLAHEWFHALDNYLARQDGKAPSERAQNKRGDMTFPVSLTTGKNMASGGFRLHPKSGVREEVRTAFKKLIETMYFKAEQFVEDTAKAEKFVGAAARRLEEKLQEIRNHIAKDRQYGGKKKAATTEQLQKFDELAAKLTSGEDIQTEWRLIPGGNSRYGTHRTTNDTIEELSKIFKDITGRSGFTAEKSGMLNYLVANINDFRNRSKLLEEAAAQDVKTKKVPTSYRMENYKIDQGRTGDYWTTEHEMAARAFSAYVEDKVSEHGNKSDFLSYGADNNLPWYRMFNVRPFPEGAERVSINKAFDEFVGTLKTKETDKGTALYSNPMFNPKAIVESLSGLKENIKEDFPKLVNLGQRIIHDGVKDYQSFAKKMKEYLGGLWASFKGRFQAIYAKAREAYRNSPLKNEVGAIGDIDSVVKSATMDSESRINTIEEGNHINERTGISEGTETTGSSRSENRRADAESYARAVHGADGSSESIGTPEPGQTELKGAEKDVYRAIKARETEALRNNIESIGSFPPDGFVSAWKAQGERGGTEHKVALSPDGKTIRKFGNSAINHTWADYFRRLSLHNKIFGATAYKFKGMSLVGEELHAVIDQTFFEDESIVAAKSEYVDKQMIKLGFKPYARPQYAGKALEVTTMARLWVRPDDMVAVWDVRPANVLYDTISKELLFIDPVIEQLPSDYDISKLTPLEIRDDGSVIGSRFDYVDGAVVPRESFILDSLGLQQIYERLAKVKLPKEATGDLRSLGAHIYAKGSTAYKPWFLGMKEFLGKQFNKFKAMLENIFKFVTTKMKEDRGSFSFESSSPDVESRWQAAKGLGDNSPTWKEHVSDIKDKIMKQTQHFSKLDMSTRTGKRTANILRVFESSGAAAKAKTVGYLHSLTKNLSEQQMEIFTRSVIIGDLMNEASKGHQLPFGYTPATLVADHVAVAAMVNQSPEIQAALDKRKETNKEMVLRLVENGLLPVESVLKESARANYERTGKYEESDINTDYYRHQVLAHAAAKQWAGVSTAGEVRNKKRGWQKQRLGSELDINTNFLEAEFEWFSQSMKELATKKALDEVLQINDITAELKADAKTNNVADWKTLIPEDHIAWQPVKGSVFYRGMTLTEEAVTKFIEENPAFADIATQFREVMIMGGKKQQAIIPVGLAETLDNLRANREEVLLDTINKKLIGAWKVNTLLNPHRVIKYNLNNMSGDMDAAVAADPAILKYMWQAFRNAIARKSGKEMSQVDKDMLDRGVLDAGISINEIPDINKLPGFKHLSETARNTKLWESLKSGRLAAALLPNNLVAKYFDFVSGWTQVREGLLREAAYLRALELLNQGKKVYWASDAMELNSIPDVKDKAAKLSRELLGDYGAISTHGEKIRTSIVPFWSWMEINAPRYYQIFKNATLQGEGGSNVARMAAVGSRKIVGASLGIAEKVLLVQLLFALVSMYNRLLWPDEEEALGENGRKQLHVILGKTSDGKVLTVKFQGAFSDVLGWVGLEDYPSMIRQYAEGKMDNTDAAKKMLMATPNKLANASFPFVKLGAELISGKSFYPDITRPTPIRDRKEHLARFFTFDEEYKAIAGKPSTGYLDGFKKTLVYESDPGEQAYNTIRSLAYDYQKKHGKEAPSGSPTAQANALYYYRQAIRYDDEVAKAKYMQMYLDGGGKRSRIREGINRAKPLEPLPVNLRYKFRESLSAAEKETLKKANEWYVDTYKK